MKSNNQFEQDRRRDTNIGLITIAIVIATFFFVFGIFCGYQVGKDSVKEKTKIIHNCPEYASEDANLYK